MHIHVYSVLNTNLVSFKTLRGYQICLLAQALNVSGSHTVIYSKWFVVREKYCWLAGVNLVSEKNTVGRVLLTVNCIYSSLPQLAWEKRLCCCCCCCLIWELHLKSGKISFNGCNTVAMLGNFLLFYEKKKNPICYALSCKFMIVPRQIVVCCVSTSQAGNILFEMTFCFYYRNLN